jgi:hypothetical protein
MSMENTKYQEDSEERATENGVVFNASINRMLSYMFKCAFSWVSCIRNKS